MTSSFRCALRPGHTTSGNFKKFADFDANIRILGSDTVTPNHDFIMAEPVCCAVATMTNAPAFTHSTYDNSWKYTRRRSTLSAGVVV